MLLVWLSALSNRSIGRVGGFGGSAEPSVFLGDLMNYFFSFLSDFFDKFIDFPLVYLILGFLVIYGLIAFISSFSRG